MSFVCLDYHWIKDDLTAITNRTLSLTEKALEALSDHWALDAIGSEDVTRALDLVNQRLGKQALGKQISATFEENAEDDPLLERVTLAFELAAIEGLDQFSRPAVENQNRRNQTVAASFLAFEIQRVLLVPAGTHERLFFVLQLSAIAVCGDRRSDLLRWFREHEDSLRVPSMANEDWDRRLLYRLFDCWVRLFRDDGCDDLDRVREIIASLRKDQRLHEERRLTKGSVAVGQSIAYRLAALYNWAKTTETLATCMLQGEPGEPFGTLDRHFDVAIKATASSGDAQLELVLRWLHATARIMVRNSPYTELPARTQC